MTDLTKLKELAELMRGWPNKECWPGEGEEDGLWFVGSLNEDDQTYPVLTIDTAQWDAEHDSKPMAEYYAAANPKAILGLIAEVERLRGCVQEWERSIGAKAYIDSVMLREEVERLRTRLEINERTPYDGIACRDETIKVLDEKCDRLKAENEVLEGLVMKMFEGIAKTDPEGVKKWMAAQEGGGI